MNQEHYKTILQTGYPDEWRVLEDRINAGRMHHAALITGPESGAQEIAAETMALLLHGAATLNEAQADIATWTSEPRFVVDDAHAVRQHVNTAPVAGERRIAIIHHADRMTNQAANALLKSIEEPPQRSAIILTSAHPEAIIDTIRSRMQQMTFPALSHIKSKEIASLLSTESHEEQERLVHRSQGKLGRLVQLHQDPEWAAAEAARYRQWLQFLRASVAERDRFIQQVILKPSRSGGSKNSKKSNTKKGADPLHQLPVILSILTRLLHDALLLQVGQAAFIHTIDEKEHLQQYAYSRTLEQLQRRLELLEELREICDNNGNKKMIFEALIAQL